MSDTASRQGRFVVSARCKDGLIRQTRVNAASAIVLAQSWRSAGHVEVIVIDPSGKMITPESYQAEALRKRQRLR